MAKVSENINTVLITLTLLSFAFHSFLLYVSFFGNKSLLSYRREMAILFLAGVPLFFLLAFFVPKDFVKHRTVFNPLEPEPPLSPLEGEGLFRRNQGSGQNEEHFRNGKPLGSRKEKYPSELQLPQDTEGNSREEPAEEREQREQTERTRRNKLYGVPSENWEQFQRSDMSRGKQLAVMVVASEIQPVYSADTYLTEYDPEKGFLPDKDELLNELRHLHLISVWKDPERPEDELRSPYPVFYLSTLKDRVLAYRPFQVEPTVLDPKYHPFHYSYQAISVISRSQPEDWKHLFLHELNTERIRLNKYLEVRLAPQEEALLRNHLRKMLSGVDTGNYFQVLDAILKSYRSYKYKFGFQETTKWKTLRNFLFQTKEGDCTEFSASTALLLRLANIPARVVYGWIASRDLQTPAHTGGLAELRKKIHYLQKYELKDLYLVTTAHRHAWVQVYFPRYGWVDIETTSYAIPPEPEFDPNAQDVVIPLIQEPPRQNEVKKFEFPFFLFAVFTGGLLAATLTLLYLYKLILYVYLYFTTRRYASYETLRRLSRYYYMQLYESGYPGKKIYETPLEYIKKVPATETFAKRLTEISFGIPGQSEKKKKQYEELLGIARNSLKELKPKGFFATLKRIFSLKSVFFKF